MTSRPPEPIRHILCNVDGSDEACRAADRAARLAFALNAELTYLAVAREGPSNPAIEAFKRTEGLQGTPIQILTRDTEVCLQTAIRAASRAGHPLPRRIVRTGAVADTVLNVASEIGADTIVLGHGKARRLRRPVLGSVAQSIADRGTFLVVLVG